jgi:hypothetical protein
MPSVVEVHFTTTAKDPKRFEEILERVRDLPRLRCLSLDHHNPGIAMDTPLPVIFFEILFPKRPNILRLTERAQNSLGKLHSLEVVSLENIEVGDQGWRQLAHLPNLNSVAFLGPVDDDDLHQLAALPQLRSLTFNGAADLTAEQLDRFKRQRPGVNLNW